MFKVLIVDDDMIVRVGIKMIADWKKHEMEVIGEASDGYQGMEIFHLYNPDLILTDIKMPGMDGIEMLKQIRAENSDVRIILLTNYDDKENLKEAIRYGANDFIAKNELNEEMMEKLLQKEFYELQKNKKSAGYEPAFEIKKKTVNFFFETGVRNSDYEKEFIENFQILENTRFSAGIIQISSKKEKSDVSEKVSTERLMQVISGVLTGFPQSIIWENKWNKIVIFVFDNKEKLNESQFYDLCVSVSNVIKLYTKAITHICASGLITSVEELYLLKSQLSKSILISTFFEGNKIVTYQQAQDISSNTNITRDHKNFLQKLYLCHLSQYDEVKKICRYLIQEASREKNINLKRLLCSEFVAWYRRNISIIETVTDENMSGIEYNLFLSAFDDKELEERINCLLDQLEETLQECHITENDTINNILSYISQNYTTSLSLTDVAEYVHLSKSYVSTLFNNVMHVSFAEYLSKFRIEKSKEILTLTNYKISEVSELVGFSSEKYFSVTFKNITGITPKEYRQIHADSNILNYHNILNL